jgi:hypothetical protein
MKKLHFLLFVFPITYKIANTGKKMKENSGMEGRMQ